MYNLENNSSNTETFITIDKEFDGQTLLLRRFRLMLVKNWRLLNREFKDRK